VLVISNMQSIDAGQYSVIATQPDLRLSVAPAPATLSGPVTIVQQPQPRGIPLGGNATFQVMADGFAPFSYQWLFNGTEIAGATAATLVLTNAQLAQQGHYSVVVSNSYGTLDSSQAELMVLIRPVLTLQPLSQSVVAGGSVTLSASAEGNPWPLTFRWRKNGAYISNFVMHGTDSFLTVTGLQATASTNQFHFTVIVTNLAGASSLSSDAAITVLADTDGDGLPDEWELAHHLNPADPADAALDSDQDGVSNADEYLAGTDPSDQSTYLKVDSIRTEGSPSTAWIRF